MAKPDIIPDKTPELISLYNPAQLKSWLVDNGFDEGLANKFISLGIDGGVFLKLSRELLESTFKIDTLTALKIENAREKALKLENIALDKMRKEEKLANAKHIFIIDDEGIRVKTTFYSHGGLIEYLKLQGAGGLRPLSLDREILCFDDLENHAVYTLSPRRESEGSRALRGLARIENYNNNLATAFENEVLFITVPPPHFLLSLIMDGFITKYALRYRFR
jgi:hypothetical protein